MPCGLVQLEMMSHPVVDLSQVLITAQLALRPPSPRDPAVEAMALARIAHSMEKGRSAVFTAICDMALSLCHCGSAGISVLNDPPSDGFTWEALSGVLAPYQNGRAPRYDSPCGVTVDMGSAQLFAHPERHFRWMSATGVPIAEGLVVPLFAARRMPYGALWVIKHGEGDQFTRSQADIMDLLGGHVSAVLQLQAQRTVPSLSVPGSQAHT